MSIDYNHKGLGIDLFDGVLKNRKLVPVQYDKHHFLILPRIHTRRVDVRTATVEFFDDQRADQIVLFGEHEQGFIGTPTVQYEVHHFGGHINGNQRIEGNSSVFQHDQTQ